MRPLVACMTEKVHQMDGASKLNVGPNMMIANVYKLHSEDGASYAARCLVISAFVTRISLLKVTQDQK